MNRKFIRVFFNMACLLILAKILGFIKNMLIASSYGSGFIADIYAFEDGLVNELCGILLTFLGCTFIPTYVSLTQSEKYKLSNLIITVGSFSTVTLFVLGVIFTEELLEILVPGYFELYDIDQVILITRVSLVNIVGVFLINFFTTLLQANEIFEFLTIETFVSGVFFVFYLLLFPQYGIWGLVGIRLLVSLVIVLVLIKVSLKRDLLHFKFNFNLRDSRFTSMLRKALPMLAVAVLYQLNFVVDRSMASGLDAGTVSRLHYANVVSMLIYNIIGYIVSSYAYPILGKLQNNDVVFKERFNDFFVLLCNLVLPSVIVLAFYAQEIVLIMYGRGAMKDFDLVTIAEVIVCYLPGIVACCVRNYYIKLFYIKGKILLVVVMDVLGVIVNVFLNLFLARMFGIYGLAIATSVTYFLTALYLVLVARIKKYADIAFSTDILIQITVALLVNMGMSYMMKSLEFGMFSNIVAIAVCLIISMIIFNYRKVALHLKDIY